MDRIPEDSNHGVEISIVIVNWNTKDFLLGCVESIVSQPTDASLEITVVDNGSTDGSVAALSKAYPEVRIMASEVNMGFARANNIGINASKGRYVALINSDVVVLGNCLDAMYEFLETNQQVGLLGPRVLNADGTLQRSCTRFPTIPRMIARALAVDNLLPAINYFPHQDTSEVDALSGCFLMARKEAIADIGLLDEDYFMYAEDKDWCKRFKAGGWKVVYYPSAEAIHYGGASSNSVRIESSIRMDKANLKYWKKFHGPRSRRVFHLILVAHQVLRILGCILFTKSRKLKGEQGVRKLDMHTATLKWLLGLDRHS